MLAARGELPVETLGDAIENLKWLLLADAVQHQDGPASGVSACIFSIDDLALRSRHLLEIALIADAAMLTANERLRFWPGY